MLGMPLEFDYYLHAIYPELKVTRQRLWLPPCMHTGDDSKILAVRLIIAGEATQTVPPPSLLPGPLLTSPSSLRPCPSPVCSKHCGSNGCTQAAFALWVAGCTSQAILQPSGHVKGLVAAHCMADACAPAACAA
jgi:hypothetical protein